MRVPPLMALALNIGQKLLLAIGIPALGVAILCDVSALVLEAHRSRPGLLGSADVADCDHGGLPRPGPASGPQPGAQVGVGEWVRKSGRRLDHMWASPELAPQATSHRFVEETRRWEQPSDHVPLITEFDL